MGALQRTAPVSILPPDYAARVVGERGSMAHWLVAPNVYVTVAVGHMTREMSQLIIEQSEPLYASGHTVHAFHDWLDMSGYESACRLDLTAWVLRHRARSEHSVGVVSRLVAMGVAVANLALGDLIRVFHTRSALGSALADTVARVAP